MQLTGFGLILLLCAVPVFLASAYAPAAAPLGVAWMGLVVLAAVWDGLAGRRTARFELSRHVDPRLSLGAANRVRLRLRSLCARPLRLEVKDNPPPEFRSPHRRHTVALPAWGELEVVYDTTPVARGDFAFGDIHVRGSGRLGLTRWVSTVRAREAVRVYPDLLEVSRYELLARSHRLHEIGLRPLRQRGRGTQFEALRDYVPDDDYRDIDWKATARRCRPVSREYGLERSQNLMLMLDAGRMMTAQIGGVSKLDYALNAALMLAHVACTRDDAVGLVAFGRRVESFLPLRKGKAQVARILDQLYALQPTLDEPDYRAAFATLAERSRRRALVVVFTDLIDVDASSRLITHVAALAPRHLPLIVTIRDSDLEAEATRSPAEIDDVYQRAIAGTVLAAREHALAWMRSRGVLVADAPAGELTVAALSEYLRVKAAGGL